MIFRPIAMALEWVLGGGMAWFTAPLLALGFLTTSHLAFEHYKERLRLQGEARCDARWEEQIRTEEKAKARQEVEAARAMLDAERRVAMELSDENERIAAELQDMAADTSDGNCLSGRVLDKLNKRSPRPVKPSAKQGAAPPAS